MMEPVSLPAVPRVALCGGTHGNELSGVYLVREWQRKELEEEAEAVVTVISNPRAIQRCSRYIEQDLNRCFTAATLSIPISDGTPYEIARAQELNALLGPRGSDCAIDLICDLHNTTANMGLSPTPIATGSACTSTSISRRRYPLCPVFWNGSGYSTQLSLSGIEFEGGVLEVYTFVKNIDYPRDPETHELTAVIHPQLQDRDFCRLCPGDPMFLSFSGETLAYKGEEPLYPVFVNESAYYEKGTALTLTRMKKVEIPPLCVKRLREGEEEEE
ncbi:hypothetical protein SKAU_G00392970 [Synaphobranchus kaupii]|uniref:N-acyl-aromatic-L-amino acid amidohydrolase n=1 Tax=Synaphobranchus kaupii TaxID=118154 RepID=A0A9Q1ICY8_SYNKA|nr:hypothetical protein SKAU_G00392970 [Synaphobranchus kaupii]